MRTRLLTVVSAAVLCLSLLTASSTSGAQGRVLPVPREHRYSGISESTPPERELEPLWPCAPERPRPATGYVPPPIDLSHLTAQTLPAGVRPQALPSSFDWRDQGRVTPVRHQGYECGACYAFAAVANFEAKLLVDGAEAFDLSENNAKECNWRAASLGRDPCAGGNYGDLVNFFTKKGTVLESCDPYVGSDVACNDTCPYQKTFLDWRIISGDVVPNTAVLKQYIFEHGPVFTTLNAGQCDEHGCDAWGNEFGDYDGSYTLYYDGPEPITHAVLIVGWDDNLPHAGGSGGWIVKNSWGTDWGGTCGYGTERGYFTIAYGSANIGRWSSFMADWEDYDPTGDVMYYDEGGLYGLWPLCGNTTGWGLAEFTPAANTYVTRVEFWTTDVTTDIDVYIYDDFDGHTPTNLLRQSLNHSFTEAGYHSVPLASPLPITAGDDVIAAVKFTNEVCTSPIPIDMDGPTSWRTYVSCDGAADSWGDGSPWDVAIRLRTSTTALQGPTLTRITPSGGANTGVVRITNLSGSHFRPGASVKLTQSGQPDIHADNVDVVSASQIRCDFDLTGAATGSWDLLITNPDGQGATLHNGFTVRRFGSQVSLPLVLRMAQPVEVSLHDEEAWVSSGSAIYLTTGWYADTAGYVQDYLDAMELTVTLDGAILPNVGGYWGRIALCGDFDEDGDMDYVASWRYPVGVLSTGDHSVESDFNLPYPLTDGFDWDGDGELDVFGSWHESLEIHVGG